jgi:hypothetical protein
MQNQIEPRVNSPGEQGAKNVNVPQSTIIRVRVLFYSVLSVSLAWFLFWIFYETMVLNKSLIQVQPSNYVGLAATLGVIVFETKIDIHRLASYLKPKSSFEKRALQLEKIIELPLRIGDCPYGIDYFDQPNRTGDIPAKCLGCSNIVECACHSKIKMDPAIKASFQN